MAAEMRFLLSNMVPRNPDWCNLYAAPNPAMPEPRIATLFMMINAFPGLHSSTTQRSGSAPHRGLWTLTSQAPVAPCRRRPRPGEHRYCAPRWPRSLEKLGTTGEVPDSSTMVRIVTA